MSSVYEPANLHSSVTPDQRDRAEAWLKDAYAEGRVGELEFDTRMGQILAADNRKELNEAFYGLVRVPTPSQALGVHPAYQPFVPVATRDKASRGGAAMAHFSALFLSVLGPALVYAVAAPGSATRREAARSFNFTLTMLIGFFTTGVLAAVTERGAFGLLTLLFALSWVVLTVVGGAKVAQGEPWRNPVQRVLNVKALSEK